jgi:hypothetical protein
MQLELRRQGFTWNEPATGAIARGGLVVVLANRFDVVEVAQ